MGRRRVPRGARGPPARRQRPRRPLRTAPRVPRRLRRVRCGLGPRGALEDDRRAHRRAGAHGGRRGVRAASGPGTAGGDVPARGTPARAGDLGDVRRRRDEPGAGGGRHPRADPRLAVGVPHQRAVRARRGAGRARAAAGVDAGGNAATRPAGRRSVDPGAGRHRVRVHRGRRRGLDERAGARRGRGRPRRDRVLRPARARAPRTALRRAGRGAPRRDGRRGGHPRDLHRLPRNPLSAAAVPAVRPGRVGPRLGGRALADRHRNRDRGTVHGHRPRSARRALDDRRAG